jgi:hypothetical protein
MMQPGGPPDTSAYYQVAYVWVAAVYIGYSALLWARGRRVRERLEKASDDPRATNIRAGRDA